MNSYWKNSWVDALRSGQYSQTEEILRDNAGFCCLGVLCDLYRKELNVGTWEDRAPFDSDGSNFVFVVDKIAETGTLPVRMAKMLDLDENSQSALIDLNDQQGFDFDEIADWIEENL